MLSGFDHAIVAVRELDDAIAQYMRLLGAEPGWRGSHPGQGTAAALFRLGNARIELLSPVAEGALADRVRARLDAEGEGLCGVAFATDDAAATADALRARGLAPSEPQPGLAVDVEGRERRFRTVALPADVARGLWLFAVERGAGDPTVAPPPPREPGAAVALDHVVINTADGDAAAALYRDGLGIRLALDREFPGRGARLIFFRLGGVTVELSARAGAAPGQAPDRLYGLAYRVTDIDAAHRRLADAGLSVTEPRDGNKPGTRVFSVKSGSCSVPTLVIRDPAREG